MKEYIEREVALNSFEEIMNIACEQGEPRIGKAMRTGTCFGIAMCRNEVRHAPAADVVEVVRCKDCVCGYKTQNGQIICKFLEAGNFIPYVKPNDYCSYGERKEEWPCP